MSLSIVTNTGAMMVRTNFNNATSSMNTAMERMTTGFKINHAKDNAAGYSIVETMSAKISSYDVAYDNCQIGLDMLTTAEENYGLLIGHLQRVRDLTEQAANGTYSTDSLLAIRYEIKARLAEVDRIAKIAEYNGLNLMDGAGVADDVIIQAGIHGATSSRITLAKELFKETNCNELLGDTVDNLATDFARINEGGTLQDADSSAESLSTIDDAIKDLSDRVTQLGAAQNRLQSAMDAINTNIQSLTQSRGTIRDADVAAESTDYVSYQILQSASATLMATANQTPSIALQLI